MLERVWGKGNALVLLVSFAITFSQFECCLFTLLIVSFAVQKLLSLIRSLLFTFVFISITLGGGSEKNLLRFMSSSVGPMLSSKSFIVSDLTFRSLIHFEFIFVYGVLTQQSHCYTYTLRKPKLKKTHVSHCSLQHYLQK